MNYGESLEYERNFSMRFIDEHRCGQWDPCAQVAQHEAVCEVCGALLVSGDWKYAGRALGRFVYFGCSECTNIGADGGLQDKRSRDVVTQSNDFEVRIVGETE